MTRPRLLVAGVGNIFHGDDGFGSEVARRLLGRTLPDGVRVVDFGIRGRDLAYELLDGPGGLILIDAMPRGGAPGTLSVVEPDPDSFGPDDDPAGSGHGMAPVEVFRLVRAMGGTLPPTLVVGCEPGPIDLESEDATGLSPAVLGAADGAVSLVESLVARMMGVEAGRSPCMS